MLTVLLTCEDENTALAILERPEYRDLAEQAGGRLFLIDGPRITEITPEGPQS